ncbi:MAG: hypothetical protein V4498_01125 [candidate division FCPU426 bacterium]
MHKRSFLLLFFAVLLLGAQPLVAEPSATQYVGWGSQMLAKKNYADAKKYFNAAVKADGKNAAAYKGLGFSMIGLGDKPAAMPYLKYSVRLNPTDQQLRSYLTAQGVSLPPAPTPAATPVASVANNATTPDSSAPKSSVNPWVLGGTIGTAALLMLFII